MAHVLDFKPNPVQKNFIESQAEADLFSSRMGEGKSTALCWAALYHTRHNPGASWALIRDTFENMQGTTQKSFFQWFPPGVMGTYHGGKKTFTWASGIADGEVIFMGMDDPRDASKLMSRPLAGIGMDEPAPAVGSVGIDEFIFDIGKSRLRQEGMKWYCLKLAENNPDESHWTYKKFVQPGTEGFRIWQPESPENTLHLPPGYYARLRKDWAHRPDLIRRFVEGEFGFQQEGKSVCPQWSDRLHLTFGLEPLPRVEVALLWDFGHTPCCIFAQRTPIGYWHILDCCLGEDTAVDELIINQVRPLLNERYWPKKCPIRHIGDPQGETREQTSYDRSAVRLIRRELGGNWKKGPVKIPERIEPLRSLLTRQIQGRGLVRVDRERAAPVWYALRGGWHFHVARTGVIGEKPHKNHPHSDVGDAVSYGAAVLFPLGRRQGIAAPVAQETGGYFGDASRRPEEYLASIGKRVPAGTVSDPPRPGSAPDFLDAGRAA